MNRIADIGGNNDLARRVRPAIDRYVRELAGQVDSFVAFGLACDGLSTLCAIGSANDVRRAWIDLWLLVRDAFRGPVPREERDRVFGELHSQLRRLQAGVEPTDPARVAAVSFVATIAEVLCEAIMRQCAAATGGHAAGVN